MTILFCRAHGRLNSGCVSDIMSLVIIVDQIEDLLLCFLIGTPIIDCESKKKLEKGNEIKCGGDTLDLMRYKWPKNDSLCGSTHSIFS
jgi:hypothetical protein